MVKPNEVTWIPDQVTLKPDEVMVKPAVVMVIWRNHLVARPHHMVG